MCRITAGRAARVGTDPVDVNVIGIRQRVGRGRVAAVVRSCSFYDVVSVTSRLSFLICSFSHRRLFVSPAIRIPAHSLTSAQS